MLNLVGKKNFSFTKPQRDREHVVFPVDFLLHLCIYKFHQLLMMMYLKEIYSLKLHRNLAMDLIATTNQAIPRGFPLIAGLCVSSCTTLTQRYRVWLKNCCPFEASIICLVNNHSRLTEVIINFQLYNAFLEISLLQLRSRLFRLHGIIQKHYVEVL